MPLSATLLAALREAVGAANVQNQADELFVYECDGLTVDRATPGAVVFVHSTEEVARVVRACSEHAHPFVARGAGTGLSGGAVALDRKSVV